MELRQIVVIMLEEVAERLHERGIGLELTEAARSELVREGYDRVYGARPLRRTVERRVETPLSKRILSDEFVEGDVAFVDFVAGEGFTFAKPPASRPEPEPVAATA